MVFTTSHWSNNAKDLALFIVEDVIYSHIYHLEHFSRFNTEDMNKLENILVDKIAYIIDNIFVDFSSLEKNQTLNLKLFVGIFQTKSEMEKQVENNSKNFIITSNSDVSINSKVKITLNICAKNKGFLRKKSILHVNMLITYL